MHEADWIKQPCRFMYEETPARDTTFIWVGAGGVSLKPPQFCCSPLCLVAVYRTDTWYRCWCEVNLCVGENRLESVSKWMRAAFRSRLRLLHTYSLTTDRDRVKSLERQEQLKSDYVWFNGDNEAAEEGVIGERANEKEKSLVLLLSCWLQARNMIDTKRTSNRTVRLFKNITAQICSFQWTALKNTNIWPSLCCENEYDPTQNDLT